MMILKDYQQNTLAVLQRFFEACRIAGPKEAYRAITSEGEIRARLGNILLGDYIVWSSIQNTPRVCIKIPTGGGKTILAAHAIKIVASTWCERENPVVLWFCPSDTIRKQTSEALKNPRHPYRVALDEQFDKRRVSVFDIEEKFNIRPADILGGPCIIVSTIQAFRQSDTDKYNVYRHNEELEPHFTRIAGDSGMERSESGERLYSFANLLHHYMPIVIVDEAHNVISGLSQEMHGRINPSAIVELTATPQPHNNTLYNVRASELKEEEMIKLPVELRELASWHEAVSEAIARRKWLSGLAADESEYIRPILLFQAQNVNGEVNVDVLRKYLIETENISADEIAVATGEQKELDGMNVLDQNCQIKYVITVEALKEGWDCSFAYVLCSLANVHSDKAVVQLLGRVMRMPYAVSRKNAALNKAYAYVLSTQFGEAAGAIVKKLKDKGFDDDEAQSAVVIVEEPSYGLFGRPEMDKVDLDGPIVIADMPPVFGVETDGDKTTITITREVTDEDVAQLVKLVSQAKVAEINYKFSNYKRELAAQSPAKRGEKFTVPSLMVELQGELVLAEPETIFEAYCWDIAELDKKPLGAGEFNIEPVGHDFVIDLDGHRLSFRADSGAVQIDHKVDVGNWTLPNLIDWLSKELRQEDIRPPQMIEWLRQKVEHLTDERGMTLTVLWLARFALANKLRAKIGAAREIARNRAYQTTLFGDKRVEVDLERGVEFCDGMYDDVALYRGSYKFKKSFLGEWRVPKFDGGDDDGNDGEEFHCAQAIDSLPQVKHWLRNVPRHKNSFWLPLEKHKFYPDFVAELTDGTKLVVEYKGKHLISADDAKEKRSVGELWEKRSGGRGLFIMVEKQDSGGRSASEQIKQKVGG